MAENSREPDEMLDRYIYDYFVKRKLHESAKAFLAEAKFSTEPVEIDAPGGFLYEWWCVVWDMHAARYNQKHSESVAAYLEAKQRKTREHQQQIQMQQMQMMQQRNVQLQLRDPINHSLGGPAGSMNSNGVLGQPSASVVAMKLYEEHMKFPQSMDSKASTDIINANKMALLKSTTNQQGQSLLGNTMGMSADLQKMEYRSQLANIIDNGSQRPLHMDPSSVYGQAFMQSNSGSCVAGLNQGVANMPLKGWPLTMQESDRPRPNSALQLHGHKNVHSQTQIPLAQSQAHGILGESSTYVETDSHKFGGCPRIGLRANNEPSTRYDAFARSPTQSSSPKMNMEQVQNAASQQQDHPQQQIRQNNNKRRQPSSYGPATSTGHGKTSSQSPNSPSSTHIPGDGTTKTPNSQPANSPRNRMVYHQEATPGLLSSYDNLEDINILEDMSFLDDNVESYLVNEGAEGIDGHNTQTSMERKAETSKGMQSPSQNI